MATELLTENIKLRVPPWVKRGIKRIARDRHLKEADIQREAFRQYLERAASAAAAAAATPAPAQQEIQTPEAKAA